MIGLNSLAVDVYVDLEDQAAVPKLEDRAPAAPLSNFRASPSHWPLPGTPGGLPKVSNQGSVCVLSLGFHPITPMAGLESVAARLLNVVRRREQAAEVHAKVERSSRVGF